jgi:colanic acid/amylovoran biosynthesis glycosyltransferase
MQAPAAKTAAPDLRICIATASQNVYSETFIRDHIARLPGKIVPITGDWPIWRHSESFILSVGQRVTLRLSNRLPASVVGWARKNGEHRLASFIAKRSDVVLAEFATVGARLVRPCRVAQVPLVVHFHGFDAYKHDTLENFRSDYQEMFLSASALVVVSKAMVEQLARLGAPKEKIILNSYGVDVGFFSPVDVENTPPQFLAVGRFVEKKAPHLTILAFERAARRDPNIRLSFVGDGPLLDSCKQLVKALQLEGAVTFLGPLKPVEIRTLMQSMRGFVQHSVTAPSGDSEGNPVAILEAGAARLPVVATRHAGIVDTVIHMKTGLLSDEMDINTMADHLVLLARDAKLASELGAHARERIKAFFPMDGSIQRLHEILGEAVQGRNGHVA